MLEMQLKKRNYLVLQEHDILPKAKLLCLLTVVVTGFKFLAAYGF